LKTVEEICPDKMSLITAISLSVNTIALRTTDLGNDIVRQLNDFVKSFKCILIALGESIGSADSTDSA